MFYGSTTQQSIWNSWIHLWQPRVTSGVVPIGAAIGARRSCDRFYCQQSPLNDRNLSPHRRFKPHRQHLNAFCVFEDEAGEQLDGLKINDLSLVLPGLCNERARGVSQDQCLSPPSPSFSSSSVSVRPHLHVFNLESHELSAYEKGDSRSLHGSFLPKRIGHVPNV